MSLEEEEYMMLKAVEAINLFSTSRKGDHSKLYQHLMVLINNNAILQPSIQGYFQCCLCNKRVNKQLELPCKHQCHRDCFRQLCLAKTNNTLDPVQLEKIVCPLCLSPVSANRALELLGSKFYDKIYTENALKLSAQLLKEDKQQRQKQIQAKRYDCPICVNSFPISQMVTLSCQKSEFPHRYCRQCTTQSIQQVIKSGKYSEKDLCCQQCKQPISEHVLRDVLSKEQFANLIDLRYRHLQCEGINIHPCSGFMYKNGKRLMQAKAEMDKKQRDKFQDELQRRCSAIRGGLKPPEVVGEVVECRGQISFDPTHDGDEIFIECYACGLETCIKGCPSAHRGSTCQRYKEWVKMTTQMTDAEAQKAMRAANMMKCPHCKMIVLKQQGCKHIRCRCGRQFCYICGVDWTGHRCKG